MVKSILLSIVALILGIVLGYFTFFRTPVRSFLQIPSPDSIGFLPYWQLGKAGSDYSNVLSSISYFGLTVGDDGSIVKLANPQEEEPGWHDLNSGIATPLFKTAKRNNQSLSLVVFSGNNDSIGVLISDPTVHADNLMRDTAPLMKQYGFSNLNLDIEYSDTATSSARQNFTAFVKEVKKIMDQKSLGTLSIDVSPSAFIKDYLVDTNAISKIVDFMIIMGYDYHFQGSFVTGPVAPLFGAGVESEFDIQTAVQKALTMMPAWKIVLGVPLYGYEWETLDSSPRSPVIPGTGLTASSQRVEQLLSTCATCSAQFDTTAQEKYVIYKDTGTNSFHQIFYPDSTTMQSKIKLAQKYQLRGVALWALGYEDKTILDPLRMY